MVEIIQTQLSEIIGDRGVLSIKGQPIEQLAQTYSFEKMAALLWQGLSASEETEHSVQHGLAEARVAVYEKLQPFFVQAATLPLIDGLKYGLISLAMSSESMEHYYLTAAMTVLLPALIRLQRQQLPISPKLENNQVTDLLAMLGHSQVTKAHQQALTMYLVTVAEHGVNASTFTARVIASTRSDMNSAIVGALGALKGPLHGGAPGPVLDMLDEIKIADNIEPWLEEQLMSGQRLMGFGHRIYHTRDPRADVLKEAVRLLKEFTPDSRLGFAEEVERKALKLLQLHKPERLLQTNVEFYTAILLDALGFEREAFTPLFATGRILGWIAHIMEQWRFGRLIRPQSTYVKTMAA